MTASQTLRTAPESRRAVGALAIGLAIGFNLPYAILATTFDYPSVLRGTPEAALELFRAGGVGLVLTWEAFLLSALALVVLAPPLALTRDRLMTRPGLAVGAAISGALAGLAQAVGLSRWVFAVPELARTHDLGDTGARLASEQAFGLLNAWGGVAIGEHLGQLLTALFVLQLAMLQSREGARLTSILGFVGAALLFVGAGEGLAIATGGSGEAFSFATIGGFLGLTLWLIATGVGLLRGRRSRAVSA